MSKKKQAIQLIRSELATIRTKKSKCKDELRELTAAEKPLEASLNALMRSPATNKPAPKKKDVIVALSTVLAKQGPLSEADLKAAVWDQVSKLGLSHAGLALRFDESLASPKFLRANGTVSLATNLATPKRDTALTDVDMDARRAD